MDRDGTRSGYDLELTRAIADRVDVPVIASGGVGTLEHLREGLVEGRADAVLAASIFHFGNYLDPRRQAVPAGRGRARAAAAGDVVSETAQRKLTAAVVQHALTGRVLMLGYMDDEALAKTRESGDV